MEENKVEVIQNILGKQCATLYKNVKKAVGYKGRKFFVKHFKPMALTSFWCEGSRDYFYYVNLRDYSVSAIRQNGTCFDGLNLRAETLEHNQVLVEVNIFRGKAVRCTMYC